MTFGLGVLRMDPHNFWRATPREIQAASEAFFKQAKEAPSRIALDELMRLFPDKDIL